ncbi:DUF1684 domain-containing protein [Motilibacter peucedani]|uniref:DUF1684 domain-containing protein n=1 Tax=Motilibacter peucedani TaxID=598650 RepID=UPI001E51A3B4|nr:DUF1684 domain-containing protein [Motilibacter peucedani]
MDVLELADWRRRMQQVYAAVRRESDPRSGHKLWRAAKDELFRSHPQSPLPADDPLRETGLPYWPYDPALRFVVPLQPVEREQLRVSPSSSDGEVRQKLVGLVEVPDLGITLDVWWLDQYAGGLFVPVKDGTARTTTYGAGRYLVDTAKGADLGLFDGKLVLDFNFLYHPSCRYDPVWECPLAAAGNTTTVPIEAGERLAAG